MIPFFDELASRIDAAWSNAGTVPETLPGLATIELARLRPCDHVGIHDVIEWVARSTADELVDQADIAASFGQPPVTVASRDGFRIDVNLWVDSSTAIHEHAFAGAFAVLDGSSVEGCWTWEATENTPRAHHGIGHLRPRLLERLRKGDVRPIHGGGSIHGLIHIESPSATVVVRTEAIPAALPQRTFQQPGLCQPTKAVVALSEHDRRRGQIAEFLFRTRGTRAVAQVREMMAEAGLGFAHLIAASAASVFAEAGLKMDEIATHVTALCHATPLPEEEADVLAAAVLFATASESVVARRSRLLEPVDRVIASALALGTSRPVLVDFLETEYPEMSPSDVLLSFLKRSSWLLDLPHGSADALQDAWSKAADPSDRDGTGEQQRIGADTLTPGLVGRCGVLAPLLWDTTDV